MAEYNPSKIIKDGNTYNFRDDTKIPLAGSNAISGSLIPATDNSIDVGSSTKNIKMLYTKGITIDGKTVDTDANGNMAFNGNELLTSAVKEGNFNGSSGWCLLYGDLLIQWGSEVFIGQGAFTFSKPFAVPPSVVMNYGDTSASYAPCAIIVGQTASTYFTATNSSSGSGGGWRCNWIAIGKKGY